MNASSREKPVFTAWNLASASSGLRIFETIGSLFSLGLIGAVGSHFSPTYAALVSCTAGTIISSVFVVIFAFNLHNSTPGIQWILWESIYTGAMAFLFLINTTTMFYSSLRWQHTAWWFSFVSCALVTLAFVGDWFLLLRLQNRNPTAKHSQDDFLS
ncbi:unnamed protein product [Caenorhabditis auriculariae]|uniref:MARVEL domain-containing protein n=1 Tax=Caenorhabditis auriculariae TaxID=2777116 RepID=A0A8S1GN67_9PELO|nr:unnamed protein product [Caenorhabditis auriculariae]